VELHRAVSREFGGHQAHPGEIDSPYALSSAVQRPQMTVFGKDAYPTLAEKAAVLLFAIVQNVPFRSGNRRVALASLLAFIELNSRSIDSRILDEKTLEQLIKRAAVRPVEGAPPDTVFHDLREMMHRAIM